MKLKEILELLIKGKISIQEAEQKIRLLALEEIENKVKMDLGREMRRDVPEIIWAEYKDDETLRKTIIKTVEKTGKAIISNIKTEQIPIINSLKEKYEVRMSLSKRVAVIKNKNHAKAEKRGKVGIVAAGTADIPLADEVRFIAEELGCETVTIYDAGIAALHRTISAAKKMIEEDVDVIVAVAGMEGALPSVIASLVNVPVIGLPASIGYGPGGNGTAALMSMLQACSPGLLVVNVDNSIGAAISAVLIAYRAVRTKSKQVET
ncbi:MAG: nickel pincer cofactor biosynthesis protein LarB [archaeon GB-1867-005]|nr:nickel pincer cofactor biosynthesis protein LarB [Candidatus Culexmicrobium cathedralense]